MDLGGESLSDEIPESCEASFREAETLSGTGRSLGEKFHAEKVWQQIQEEASQAWEELKSMGV